MFFLKRSFPVPNTDVLTSVINFSKHPRANIACPPAIAIISNETCEGLLCPVLGVFRFYRYRLLQAGTRPSLTDA